MSQTTPEHQLKKFEAYAYKISKQIGTKDGYFTYFFKILPRCSSQRAAYEIVELMHLKIFNEEKYKTYESFRHMKNKWLKS